MPENLSQVRKLTVRYGNMTKFSPLSVSAPHQDARRGGITQLSPPRHMGSVARGPMSRTQPAQTGEGILDARKAPYALLILRLTLGAMFLQHVMRIVFGFEPPDVSQLFALPAGVSPYALAWDTLIGLALLYGLWPRVAAIAGAATLSLAAITTHSAAAISPFAWQLPILWIAALLALALAGDGAFALVPSRLRSRTEHRA
jgi:putative oxidoreductase